MMWKEKALLLKLIEREKEYLDSCTVGSEEYNASLERLTRLQEQWDAQKDRRSKTIVEGAKVVSGVALPVFGWVVITAFEKGDTITTALRKTVDCFIPRKI